MDYNGTEPIFVILNHDFFNGYQIQSWDSHVDTAKEPWIKRTVADRITDFEMFLFEKYFKLIQVL